MYEIMIFTRSQYLSQNIRVKNYAMPTHDSHYIFGTKSVIYLDVIHTINMVKKYDMPRHGSHYIHSTKSMACLNIVHI